MELVFGENPQEDVLRQNVLDQHLPHVVVGHRRADGPVAQVKENLRRFLIPAVAGLGVNYGFPQVLQHCRQVIPELLPRLPELLDFGQFVVEELPNQRVQRGSVGHVHPHRFPLVLEQDGGARVLE